MGRLRKPGYTSLSHTEQPESTIVTIGLGVKDLKPEKLQSSDDMEAAKQCTGAEPHKSLDDARKDGKRHVTRAHLLLPSSAVHSR